MPALLTQPERGPRRCPAASVAVASEAGSVTLAASAIVRLPDGSEYEAKYLGYHEPTDLALIRIDAGDLPVLPPFADAKDAVVGNWVAVPGPEAEPVAVGVAGTCAADPLEGPEESVDLGGRDRRAGVADRDASLAPDRVRGDLDVPFGCVVAQRVVDEVGHEPLDESGVAGGRCRAERGINGDSAAFGLSSAAGDDGFGDLVEIDRLPLFGAVFAGRQREQRLDEAFLLVAEL